MNFLGLKDGFDDELAVEGRWVRPPVLRAKRKNAIQKS
jgi:hypothetical protein